MRKAQPAATVDDYLAAVPPPARGTLQKIRAAIRAAVPAEATEAISYGIPTFRYRGALVAFGAFAKHCSLFPMSYAVIDEFKSQLKGVEISKGTIRFPLNKPLPAALMKRIVKARIAENERRRAPRPTAAAVKAKVTRTAKTGSTWQDVASIARALPKVEVATWYGTPGLKVAGKGFARLRTEAEGGLVLMCSLEQKAELLESGEPAYYTTPHYDGFGAILVNLAKVNRDALSDLIRGAWRIKATPALRQLLLRG